jgi:SagB-type dehydrogenase family enzyme
MALGASSIDIVKLGNRLEQEMGSRPRMDELFRLQTVADLAGYYDARALPVQSTATPAAAGSAGSAIDAMIASYRVLLDPAERDAFKKQQLGIRRDPADVPSIALIPPVDDEALRQRYRERRSQRSFSLKPIPFAQFSSLLSCLYQITLDGAPKHRYASPGGLYPVQTYLHVKPGRVDGVGAGAYYYHPIDHRLVSLHPDAEIDRGIHVPFVNTPTFDEAAFSIFLITQLSAIAPGYGDVSMHFSTLEAGIMAHLLETTAPRCGLGLCQIGSVEFDRIRSFFKLEPSHVLIHSLLGGLVDGDQAAGRSGTDAALAGDAAKMANVLGRIKQLSPEEVKALLAANRTSS